MDPERAGGDKRAFDAMRAPVTQDASHRVCRLAVRLVVDRDRVKEGLDSLRRIETRKPGELACPQAQVLAASEASA